MAIDPSVPAWWNKRRGVELLDNGRGRHRGAHIEASALVEHRLHRCSIQGYCALPLHRGSVAWRSGRRILLRLVFRYGNAHPQPIAHDFDWALVGGMAVDLGVTLIESLPYRGERRGFQPLVEQSRQRDAQLVALAAVAQVKFARKMRVGDAHAFG